MSPRAVQPIVTDDESDDDEEDDDETLTVAKAKEVSPRTKRSKKLEAKDTLVLRKRKGMKKKKVAAKEGKLEMEKARDEPSVALDVLDVAQEPIKALTDDMASDMATDEAAGAVALEMPVDSIDPYYAYRAAPPTNDELNAYSLAQYEEDNVSLASTDERLKRRRLDAGALGDDEVPEDTFVPTIAPLQPFALHSSINFGDLGGDSAGSAALSGAKSSAASIDIDSYEEPQSSDGYSEPSSTASSTLVPPTGSYDEPDLKTALTTNAYQQTPTGSQDDAPNRDAWTSSSSAGGQPTEVGADDNDSD